MEFKDYVELITSIITSLGLIIGGIWALWKFIIQKESSPKIEFNVDINFIGIQQKDWVIEILGILENKGKIPYKIKNLSFNTKFLLKEDCLEEEINFNGQVNIKNLLREKSWLPSDSTTPAVLHPGIKMRYNYIYKVSTNSSFLLIHGILDYCSGLQMRADKLVKVPD